MAERTVAGAAGRSRPRAGQMGRDMVLSMGLVALVLVVWMWFVHPRTPEGVRAVAWYPIAESAARAASYDVAAPPATFAWTATSARVEPQPDGTLAWRVGFYTPSEDYAAVLQRGVFPAQAAGSVEQWVAAQTRDGVAEGAPVVIGGRTWTRMQGDPTPDERRSLVSVADGTVTVVTGSAQWSELEELAARLVAVDPGA